jgi:hypothetical protein
MTAKTDINVEFAYAGFTGETDSLFAANKICPELQELRAFARSVQEPVRWLAYTSGKSVLTDRGLRPIFVRGPDGGVLAPDGENLPRDLTLAWDEGFEGEQAREVVFRWAIAARTGLTSSLRAITPCNETVVNGGQLRACLGEFPFDDKPN